jgi:hypothetical protein
MLAPSIDGFRLYPEPRRARPTLPHPAFPVRSTAVPSSPNFCALCVSAFNSPDPCLFNFRLLTLNHLSPSPGNSFTIRTSAKPACNPCRMRSFKTQDLKPFRMCSSKKNRGGGGADPSGGTANPGCPLRGLASTNNGAPATEHFRMFHSQSRTEVK